MFKLLASLAGVWAQESRARNTCELRNCFLIAVSQFHKKRDCYRQEYGEYVRYGGPGPVALRGEMISAEEDNPTFTSLLRTTSPLHNTVLSVAQHSP
jgi:hypothetical protein